MKFIWLETYPFNKCGIEVIEIHSFIDHHLFDTIFSMNFQVTSFPFHQRNLATPPFHRFNLSYFPRKLYRLPKSNDCSHFHVFRYGHLPKCLLMSTHYSFVKIGFEISLNRAFFVWYLQPQEKTLSRYCLLAIYIWLYLPNLI